MYKLWVPFLKGLKHKLDPLNPNSGYRVSFTIVGRCISAADPTLIGKVFIQKKINMVRAALPAEIIQISSTGYDPGFVGVSGQVYVPDEFPFPAYPAIEFEISGSFFYDMKYS